MKKLKWNEIDWAIAHENLRNMQKNIALAIIIGDKNLPDIENKLLCSFAARAIAVRNVTSSSGGKTPGVDGKLLDDDKSKLLAIIQLKNLSNYKALPVKRVWIPKANSDVKRPLGIPTIDDRCFQALFNFTLDIHQEIGANPRSFGWRKGRNVSQALNYIHKQCSNNGYRFAMKIDISKFFDMISHDWLLENIPIRRNILLQFLKPGVIDKGELTITESGTPQGGIISATLANMTLNGIEEIILDKTLKVIPIRYGDDILVLSKTEAQLAISLGKIIPFLEKRGLKINQDKTSFHSIEDGFEWLGFNFREYNDNRYVNTLGKKGTFIIKPAKASIVKIKNTIKLVFDKMLHKDNYTLLMKINPVLRGWANYFRSSSATVTFNIIGHYVWQLTWLRSRKLSKNVSRRKLVKRNYIKLGFKTKRNWVFIGQSPISLDKISLFDIQATTIVKQNELKFDPQPNPYLEEFWELFDKKLKARNSKSVRIAKQISSLLRKQESNCAHCKTLIDVDKDPIRLIKINLNRNILEDCVIHKMCSETFRKKHIEELMDKCIKMKHREKKVNLKSQ